MRVPFPYVEKDRLEARPALLISKLLGPEHDLFWAVMITSARRSSWSGDVDLADRFSECGLPVRCLIRTEKMAMLPLKTVESVLGVLPGDLMEQVRLRLKEQLALS